MKKVLFITTISGFLQQFEMNDVKILQNADCEIHYASNFLNPVYTVDIEKLEKSGIKTHHILVQKSPLHIIKNWRAYRQVKRIVRTHQIDFIHCHNPMGGVIGRASAIGNKKLRVIYTAHGFHFYAKAPLINWLCYYPVERLLAKVTDWLITINEEDYNRACKFQLRKHGKAVKIPGVGVDTKRFAAELNNREKIRKELGIPADAFLVLSVGELNHNKNHGVVLKAVSMLGNSDIYYGICGRGYLDSELNKYISENTLEKRVILYGFRNDIPRMLAAADCFVFPSKREGLGIAAIEAMSAGLPLITSDCRGTREYVVDGVNGILCRKGTPEQYANAILRLKNDEVLRSQMSKQCRKMAEKFDIAETDKIMKNVYSEVLKSI